MLDSFGPPNMAYVGCRVYAAVLRLRAGQLRCPRALGVAPPVEDEVSEEIVVWGESDDGGGGSVDVLTIPAWMFEFHINTNLPPLGPTGGVGTPGGGGDTPETDPCAGLRNALDSCDAAHYTPMADRRRPPTKSAAYAQPHGSSRSLASCLIR